jgi:hypothetical protein
MSGWRISASAGCGDAHLWLRHDVHRFMPPGMQHELRGINDPLAVLAFLEGKAGFNPDQSRVPKGNPDGGQWTADGGVGSVDDGNVLPDDAGRNDVDEDDSTEFSAIRRRTPLEDCELLYKRDLFQCRMVGSPACYHQALVRYHACQKGLPLPPLSY